MSPSGSEGRGWRRPRRRRLHLGLDIGSASVKWALLSEGDSHARLVASAHRELPLGPDGGPPPLEVVAEVLQETLRPWGGALRHLTSAVSGSQVTHRRLLLPPVPRREMQAAVEWAVRPNLPTPLEQTYWDYAVLGEAAGDGSPRLDVLMVAAGREIVERHLSLLARARLVPESITIRPLAFRRAFGRRGQEERSILLLDIGYSASTLAFYAGGALRFYREVAAGGENITQGLQGTLRWERGEFQLDRQGAETLKRLHGIPPPGSTEVSPEGIPLGHLGALMRPALERLVTEIDRSFDYYRQRFEGTSPEVIYLTGGGARLKGLAAYLEESLGIPVRAFSPVEGFALEGDDPALRGEEGLPLATAIGLALEGGQGINLLPARILVARRQVWERRIARGLAVGAFAALALGTAGLHLLLTTGRHRMEAARGEWERIRSQPSYQVLQVAKEEIASSREVLGSVRHRPSVALDVMRELSRIVPPEIVLRRVAIGLAEADTSLSRLLPPGPDVVLLEGSVLAPPSVAETSVATLLLAMTHSRLLADPALIQMEPVGGGGGGPSEFRIACRAIGLE